MFREEEEVALVGGWQELLRRERIYQVRGLAGGRPGFLISIKAVGVELAPGEDVPEAVSTGIREETLTAACEVVAMDGTNLTATECHALTRKVQVNLVHPELRDFLRLFPNGGAPRRMSEEVCRLTCSVCNALRLPKARRTARVNADVSPFDVVGMDIKELPTREKKENAARKRQRFMKRFVPGDSLAADGTLAGNCWLT